MRSYYFKLYYLTEYGPTKYEKLIRLNCGIFKTEFYLDLDNNL